MNQRLTTVTIWHQEQIFYNGPQHNEYEFWRLFLYLGYITHTVLNYLLIERTVGSQVGMEKMANTSYNAALKALLYFLSIWFANETALAGSQLLIYQFPPREEEQWAWLDKSHRSHQLHLAVPFSNATSKYDEQTGTQRSAGKRRGTQERCPKIR